MICSVAIIGANNNPLYLRSFQPEEELEFHYASHMALDIIEEKLHPKSIGTITHDLYLGFLGPIEDHRVYAYVSNTKVKFVLIVEEGFQLKDSEVKQFFTSIHLLYVDTVSNPFWKIGEPISSERFDQKIQNQVAHYSRIFETSLK